MFCQLMKKTPLKGLVETIDFLIFDSKPLGSTEIKCAIFCSDPYLKTTVIEIRIDFLPLSDECLSIVLHHKYFDPFLKSGFHVLPNFLYQ